MVNYIPIKLFGKARKRSTHGDEVACCDVMLERLGHALPRPLALRATLWECYGQLKMLLVT